MKRLRRRNINTRAFWETQWQKRDTAEAKRHFPSAVIQRLLRFQTILNVGCGHDDLAQQLRGKVACCDLSESAIEYQRDHAFDVFICSATQIPKPDASFDCVFSSHLIEHLEEPFQAIREFCRVASRSVFVICPHDEYLNEHEEHLWQITHDDLFHMGIFFGFAVRFFAAGRDIMAEIQLRE